MNQTAEDIAKAMAGLRETIEARVAQNSLHEAMRIRPGDLAGYDTAALGKVVRPILEADGRGWQVIAAEIGVTAPDLSRIMAGQPVSAPKIFAICDWAGIPDRRFYKPPKKRAVFHGKSTEMKRGLR